MKKIVKLITFIIALSIQALAQTGGDLHVKGKIRSDSLANQNYLLIYADSTGTLDTLPPGAPGQVLISNGAGTKPYWGTSSGCDSILYASFTNVGTDADTLEKVLGSYIMPGNTLNTDGSWIEIQFIGVKIHPVDIRIKFGGDIIFETFWNGPSQVEFAVSAKVYRVNNNFQKSLGIGPTGSTYVNTHSKDLSNNVTIEFTGRNWTPNANDVVLEGIIIKLIK